MSLTAAQEFLACRVFSRCMDNLGLQSPSESVLYWYWYWYKLKGLNDNN